MTLYQWQYDLGKNTDICICDLGSWLYLCVLYPNQMNGRAHFYFLSTS